MLWFGLTTLAMALVAFFFVRAQRGMRMARFSMIIMVVHIPVSIGVVGLLPPGPWVWLAYAVQALLLFQIATMAQQRMRPPWFNVLLGWPAYWAWVATFLALPWVVFAALTPWTLPALWLPFALAATGLLPSVRARKETVTLDLGVQAPASGDPRPARHRPMQSRRRGIDRASPPDRLRIVQITDPHLGPFMSEARLRGICQRAVDAQPDLIVLTGDYLTVHSQKEPGILGRALAPLAAHPHVYACLGNHDHETPTAVRQGLAAAGITLLVDQSAIVQTRLGPVELLGLDFVWRDRAGHVARVIAAHPRRPAPSGAPMLRLVLLHDPDMFRHFPDGTADLTLSGHTHGGHVGLVSLGLQWTTVGGLFGMPDHGPFALGRNRLYVHRATGHYGFPLRLGVPSEESVLEVVPA